MTPEAPSRNPQTEAGRYLLEALAEEGVEPLDTPDSMYGLNFRQRVGRIEAEAAQRVVERLQDFIAYLDGPPLDPMLTAYIAALGDSAGEEEGR